MGTRSRDCLIGEVEHYDDRLSLSAYFEQQISSTDHAGAPYNIAAIHDHSSISYRVLNGRANHAARRLSTMVTLQQVPSREYTRAGILLKEGFNRLTALLACLKLGLTVVPLSPDKQKEILDEIISETGIEIIIYGEDHLMNVATNQKKVHLIKIESLLPESDDTDHMNLISSEVIRSYNRENNVIVLYTSGSSGTAKVITLTHAQIYNRLFWQWRHLPYQPGEIVCHRTGFMFVDNIIECFSCLLAGVTMVILSPVDACNIEFLATVIGKHKVTWILSVPSLLHRWLKDATRQPRIIDSLKSLRTMVSSGEMLSPNLARMFMTVFGETGCALVNLYGSTEVTGDVSFQVFKDIDEVDRNSVSGVLTVGCPITNNRILMHPLVDGQKEVVIMGANVSPCCGTLFHTGDSGFIDNKRLFVAGRLDDMAKINGKKVYMKEIDAIILSHDDVDQCCTVHVSADNRSILLAFFTVKDGFVDVTSLKIKISKQLFVSRSSCIPRLQNIDEMPLQGQSMKPDKVKLRSLAEQLFGEEGVINEQLTALSVEDSTISVGTVEDSEKISNKCNDQQTIYRVLAKHLTIDHRMLLPSMNFYEVGGDSLIAALCLSDLNKKGFSCSTDVFMGGPSIEDIVDNIVTGAVALEPSLLKEKMFGNYNFDPLSPNNKTDVLQFLVTNYLPRENVKKCINLSCDEFLIIVDDVFDHAVKSGCSIVIRDKWTAKLVGVQLSVEVSDDIDIIGGKHGGLKIKKRFFQQIKSDNERWKGQRLLTQYILALSFKLPKPISLQLLTFIERHSIEIARNMGYVAIETVNTSEVTTRICFESGYRLIKSLSVADFMPKSSTTSCAMSEVIGYYMVLDL